MYARRRSFSPFGHPTQVNTSSYASSSFANLRQLASPFGQVFLARIRRITSSSLFIFIFLASNFLYCKFLLHTSNSAQRKVNSHKNQQRMPKAIPGLKAFCIRTYFLFYTVYIHKIVIVITFLMESPFRLLQKPTTFWTQSFISSVFFSAYSLSSFAFGILLYSDTALSRRSFEVFPITSISSLSSDLVSASQANMKCWR